MDTISIRNAQREDIPAIIAASQESSTPDELIGFSAPEWILYKSEKALSRAWKTENRLEDDSEIIVAELNGRIEGYVVFKRETESIYIDNLNIRKSLQKKGIGSALVAVLEKLAIQGEYTCITTDTTENVHGIPWKSYHFWLKLGFCDTGQRLNTQWGFKTIPLIKHLRITSDR